ncbi:MAG: hypothetical protein SGJ11_09595 [Phycisphaerae bacterium]|nr:hypothetical protein [Phycisphaerae bacterium]
MPSIEINGETVHLHQTTLRDFQRFTEIAFARLRPAVSVRETVAGILFDAMRQGQTPAEQVVQTVLWALHDLGVGGIRLDFEAKSVQLDNVRDTDASRGDSGAMGVAAVETGRAYVAALANVQARTILLNGKPIRAFPQPKEVLQRMSTQMQANRLVNEDLTFTAARAVGAMMKQGKTIEDEEFRGAVEIAASLGISSLVVDLEQQKLAIRDFSESNAASAALLQGGDTKQVQMVRERITKARSRLDDLKKQLADGTAKPGVPQRMSNQRLVLPPVIGGRRSTRRRG